jgi:uncharacterized protein YbdZ (MbtH family)
VAGTPTPTVPAATATNTPPAPTATNTAPAATATNTPVSGTATPTACPPSGTPGPWRTATPQPPLRYRSGGASDGIYIYVFGGGTATGRLNDLWRWDPVTETWTQLANMPTAKQNIQGSYWNGKLYVPGGYNLAAQHITENAIYDLAANTWSTGAPLPAGRSGATAAYNNRIYVFGGNPGPTNTTVVYDIATDSWSNGVSMPVALTYGRAITAGSYAYYSGGIPTSGSTNAVNRFDFVAGTWTAMAPLNASRSGHEMMADATHLYVVNGAPGTTYFNGLPPAQTFEIYTIATNTWVYGNPTVQTASSPSGGFAGNKLMIQGGVNGATYYNLVQVSELQDGGCPTPTATPPPPTATDTPMAPTPTDTPMAPTATNTPGGPTPTDTPMAPTATNTPMAPTATNTPGGPTPTATSQPQWLLYLPAIFLNANMP